MQKHLSYLEWLATSYVPIIGGDGDGATVTVEDVAQSVAELKNALAERDGDPITEEKVANIVTELLERQGAAAAAANKKRGFKPEETEDDDRPVAKRYAGPDRLTQINQRDAGRVAAAIRRPEADVRSFQEASDKLLILSTILRTDPRETNYFAEEFEPAVRAVSATTGGGGAEFVPRYLSANLIERVALDLKVAALFPLITMPTNPFDIPGRPVARTRTGSLAEANTDTGQPKAKVITPGSRKVTLTAQKLAVETLVDKEAEEDAIIAVMSFIEEELVDYMAADWEDGIINGDTTGSHMDSDVTVAGDPRKIFVGLRKSAVAGAKVDAGNVALTVAQLRKNRKNMGKYGVNPTRLAHVLGINNYIDLLSDTAVLTLEKYGPNATILAGELGRVDNVPIIVSEYVRNDLNATGVFDNTTTNRSEAITVHNGGFVEGEKRGVTLQLLRELYAESDQDALMVTRRMAFAARFPSTEKTVAISYNTGT